MQQTGTWVLVPQIPVASWGVGPPGGWPAILGLLPPTPTPPAVPSTCSRHATKAVHHQVSRPVAGRALGVHVESGDNREEDSREVVAMPPEESSG